MLRIKEVIKEQGTSVQEVAKKMGVQPPSLSRAINGNTTVEMLDRIAGALGVSITELFEKKTAATRCPHCGNELKINIE